MPEHSQLTGSSLHEPKGVATATSGQVYVADGAGSGTWTTATVVAGETTIVEKTDNYTLALTDKGKTLEMNAATSKTFTIPPNASVAFATNTWINLARTGAGAVTVLAGAGVTLNGVSTGSCTITAQWGGATIRKRDTNTWVIVGLHSTVV